METIEQKLDKIGPIGSEARLRAISSKHLGQRSEAAARVLRKRAARKEWMDKGLSFEQACILVNRSENE